MPFTENEILLVNPTGGWESRTEGSYFFPIGLLYLQNYLLKHDIPSTIVDTQPEKLSPSTDASHMKTSRYCSVFIHRSKLSVPDEASLRSNGPTTVQLAVPAGAGPPASGAAEPMPAQ